MGKLLSEDEQESLVNRVNARLAAEWARAISSSPFPTGLPNAVVAAITRSINSRTKTYRYVLPSQLLPKLVDRSLDCRVVQAGAGVPGAFDARSISQDVIVPFDRANNNVLGGSTEPYANNPLRIAAIVESARKAQRDKEGFDAIRLVLDYAEANPDSVEQLVASVLAAIRERLAAVAVTYPVANRVSLERAQWTITEYFKERTGGVRMQSVAVALFRTIGERFGVYKSVRSNNINAADTSTGSVADLECLGENDEIVLAVEVKDRQLELRQLQDKLPGIRQRGVRELLFLMQGGIVASEAEAVHTTVSREFASGQNVYMVEWSSFLSSCLVLFGEEGRRAFLQHVGAELDERRIDIVHRRRWAELLATA